jgi:MFS family permease
MASLTYMQLLRGNRSFRRLWWGQVISELGSWFNFIAGLGLVRVVSGGVPEVTAWLLISRTLPFALFAPLAGALVDKWSRRNVMIVSDVARTVFSLGFLFVKSPRHLWIAYACSVIIALFTALFEAAKNAATPNITGDEGLLAGNALMFSSRFLLMSIGAALGGWASDIFGYEAAFIINALSFLVSAFSVWLITEKEMRQKDENANKERVRMHTDLKEGLTFVLNHPLVATIFLVNIIWATGGGMTNLISDRLGSIVFVNDSWLKGDSAIAALYTSAGLGLFIGMLFARRVGTFVEVRRLTVPFIGWTIFAHGIIFGLAGYAPSLWIACLLYIISRALLGVEYAFQDTLFMRLVPDNLRGRVYISDRAAEISVMSLATYVAGKSLHFISPSKLTLIAGLLASLPGLMWLLLFASKRLTLPNFVTSKENQEQIQETLVA